MYTGTLQHKRDTGNDAAYASLHVYWRSTLRYIEIAHMQNISELTTGAAGDSGSDLQQNTAYNTQG